MKWAEQARRIEEELAKKRERENLPEGCDPEYELADEDIVDDYVGSDPRARKASERPRADRRVKFRSRKDLQRKIDDYFDRIDKKNENSKKREEIPTIPGLVYSLGYAKKQNFTDLKDDPEFGDIVSRALLRIESIHLNHSVVSDRQVAGTIFGLKNQFGYTDQANMDDLKAENINIFISNMGKKVQQLRKPIEIDSKDVKVLDE